MNNCPIGILDSGIGGVTVLNEIIKLLPNEQYIYYSDSIHNPYGEKEPDILLSYVEEIVQMFIEMQCKAIVFACNTATALTIQTMRKKYIDILFIGIEPAYKMVHDLAEQKNTLVMATPATITSERFLNLYHQYDNQHTILLSCPGLAELIEDDNISLIRTYLENILPNNKIEAVVLGCTHYPLVMDEIRSILGDVTFYDGSVGVALQLQKLLTVNHLLSDLSEGKVKFIDSSKSIKKKQRFFKLLRLN